MTRKKEIRKKYPVLPTKPKKEEVKKGELQLNSLTTEEEKEKLIEEYLNSSDGKGLRRLAYAMQEPTRTKLNEISLARKIFEVDSLPEGALPVYNQDEAKSFTTISGRELPPEVRNNKDGIDIISVPVYEIVGIRTIKYEEMHIKGRKYCIIERVKDALALEISLGELKDALNMLKVATKSTKKVRSAWVKDSLINHLIDTFKSFKADNLEVKSLIMDPSSFARMMGLKDIEMELPSIMNMGYFEGEMKIKQKETVWKLKYFVHPSVSSNTIYVLTDKHSLGRMPIRYDVEIKPFDYPPEREVMFSGYTSIGMCLFNLDGVWRINTTIKTSLQYRLESLIKKYREFLKKIGVLKLGEDICKVGNTLIKLGERFKQSCIFEED